MIVVDASAILELLLHTPLAAAIADRALDPAESMHAPHLLDVEVMQVLRRLVAKGAMTSDRARSAITDFYDLAIERHEHIDLLSRIWELRDSLSAYDATYLALAEALQSPLLTCDGKLARAGGHEGRIELIAR
ncbi:MAG: PIN domain-containing protein [Rhodospirillaceae bacterium]|nr:MAG: PIN domain-containing protein [Rhodospirillaceae bacterium]